MFGKKLSRGQVLAFVAGQSGCVVAMEARATAHGWGCKFEKLGHEVQLIPPVYVKPFLKRQKNEVADAEARRTRLAINRSVSLNGWNAGAASSLRPSIRTGRYRVRRPIQPIT
ncbi:transposase [Ochrobactrum cytisi]|nr:transposase [Brucella cytisi]